jgi:hypothetical protein
MVEREDRVPPSPPHLSVRGKFVVAPTIALISIHYYEQEQLLTLRACIFF